MQSFKLVDGDLVIEENDFVMVSDDEELKQCCEIQLGTNKGEWFLDPDMGLTAMNFVGKTVSEDVMCAEIHEELFKEERIQTVENITFIRNTKKRVQDISFEATGTEGEEVKGAIDKDA